MARVGQVDVQVRGFLRAHGSPEKKAPAHMGGGKCRRLPADRTPRQTREGAACQRAIGVGFCYASRRFSSPTKRHGKVGLRARRAAGQQAARVNASAHDGCGGAGCGNRTHVGGVEGRSLNHSAKPAVLGCVGGSRTRHLRLMRPASYRCSTTRREVNGAAGTNRTCDLPLTRGLLYRLSYGGVIGHAASRSAATRSYNREIASAFDERGSRCLPWAIREMVGCGIFVSRLIAAWLQPQEIKATSLSDAFMRPDYTDSY